ncbi:tRNA (adenosine(37)-N6)-threonylcarbamoyltransferase complex dimerization subunit type 1 TsaB [Deinococcus aquiradiocola]|uniref:tRNA (Adenosine(37)-N6)-threonylcarbamoyltransferase complex dimerization subunit type 1 TsaB n=1 Tax=Deinococcus aquiradiocola TaxID=393059 RepID=A0A917P6J8_9DEIO|nr:tRNA (adenosine(37)-N6)-threonylcarbamoyltransferase complex dimerization subunit type 1 TsaB [Deinococcus aquiradiocola]GGJ63996.1 tRNA (adenosine(37)-N6)-threonylcarbamoyltransferase complex dimerization subunit type 1 TsaB [Deinococcus aquiradiocola]
MNEPLTRPASIVLSIDTGTPHLALGLTHPGGRTDRVTEVGRAHAERLPGELEALFLEAGLPKRADLIVVGTGPGSYTGLRVGASYALGLGRAWGAPVVGVSTLEALTGRVDGTLAVSMDARKEQVYGAVFRVSGGVVVEELHAGAKYPLTEFERLAAGLPWHRDVQPDPQALARNGVAHGRGAWELSYL